MWTRTAGSQPQGMRARFRRRIERYVYELSLSAFCSLMLTLWDDISEYPHLYFYVAHVMGWKSRREWTLWLLIALIALALFAVVRSLSLFRSTRMALWPLGALALLAGYPLALHRIPAGLHNPPGAVPVLAELTFVLGLCLATTIPRLRENRRLLRVGAVLLHIAFWTLLASDSWRGDIVVIVTGIGVLLGLLWACEGGRDANGLRAIPRS
jgi:hypothetical protein